ncbi:hypothetical protein V2G26_004820 [Clonostachys chloroleuca]
MRSPIVLFPFLSPSSILEGPPLRWEARMTGYDFTMPFSQSSERSHPRHMPCFGRRPTTHGGLRAHKVSPTQAFTCRLRAQYLANQGFQPERCRQCAIIWYCVNSRAYLSLTPTIFQYLAGPERIELEQRKVKLESKIDAFRQDNEPRCPSDSEILEVAKWRIERRLNLVELDGWENLSPDDFEWAFGE